MAEKERTYMPQSTAGLIRYFESEGGVKLRPHLVLAIGAGFGLLVIAAKFIAVL
ncbi:MAG: preprotein translocase subunit Sec61beta [Candidatus Aenigmarchaeota archaeon]|nr:preprotein translocase subunit Sec61beta [Candidatus Aenigmarchaeota archaeon]